MSRNHFRYFVILLAAAIFFLFFNGYLSSYVLLCVLLFPVFSLLISLPGMLSVRLSLSLGAVSAKKGQEIPLRLKVKSRFPIAGGRVDATLTVKNTLTGETQEEKLAFTPCRGEQALGHRLSSPACGLVVCGISKVRAWDYLGLVPLPLKRDQETSALFFPVPQAAFLTAETITMPGGEGDSYSQNKPGDDPSELFGLREYQPGDKLSRVHWKLSQKTGQTLVREFGLPIADHLLFLVEPNGAGEETDALLDAFMTLSSFLTEREIAHRVGFDSDDADGLRLLEIAGPGDEKPALRNLLAAGRRAGLPPLTPGDLPAGVSHALYLTCAPRKDVLSLLRTRLPSARLSVLYMSQREDPEQPVLPDGAEYILLHPGRVGEGLNGLKL